ncbi:YfcC family protein [Angelakisella massiliensis]|uniref:YfcC family protein n=1 Tax=Angelakisella massiliensis TaxID=1871018 RepID=UPI0008F89E18|nr:Na+/H+ antiporter NhaC family protein [Angelakisella massiliensis]
MQEQGKVKKKLAVPHSLAIIVVVMLLAAALTYIIPAGSYDRTVNEAGQTVVDPNSFHYVEASPVNPLSIFNYVYTGLDNARSIIFVLLAAGGGLGIILDTGVFQAAAGTLSRRTKGKESLVVAVLMTVFCLLCVPINLNTFIPFAPLGVLIAASLGLDAVVGVSIIMLGGAVGFSCGAMNLSNTGTAQQLAELDIFSGMAYRLFCMVPFLIVTILYVVWYAKKVKNDPTKSYVYGIKLDNNLDISNIPEFTKAHILPAVATVAGIGYIIYVAIFGSLTNQASTAIFIYMGFIVGIVARMPVNKICRSFVNGAKGMCSTAMLLGFAYAISAILNAGNVMDTVVYALASVLSVVPNILQAPAMFFMHIIVNLFVTSGSGQAAITMPIFIPVADLVGMTRQTAVLAFNFGDGFCNFILPHAAATMGFVGAAGIPFSRWFKFAVKLFAIWCVIGSLLLIVATMIGYA